MESSTSYRKDIDGLRAVAVSLVLIHHAGIHLVPGGYVGVDVFFVISGFLITGIIYNKSLAGNFSFADFYVRRIKRLMPALFAVLAVTSVCAYLLLLPTDLKRYGWSTIWVSLYAGNFFFWQAHGGYFGGNAQEAPLLHTWSLAVEEQYYLIWPIAVVLGLRWFGPKVFGWLTIVGLIAATVFSEWATQATIGAAYYLLPSRFFQLMLGSLLALYWTRLPNLPAPVSHLTSVTGIALVIGSALLLTKSSSFPGINAIYPTVGSALLILSNRGSMGIANRMLALRPFVLVGLISYSLYLWHWPIFAFLRYTGVPLTPAVQAGAIALALILAYLCWRFVETPFRHGGSKALGAVSFRYLFAPGVAVALVAVAFILPQGLPDRFPPALVAMDAAGKQVPHELREGCHVAFRNRSSLPDERCRFGSPGEEIDGLLLGDSHANHLSGFVDHLAQDADLTFLDYTMDQCPPIFGLAWGRNASVAEGCRRRNEQARAYLAEQQPRYVVLAASWPSERALRVYRDGTRVTDQAESHRLVLAALEETIVGLQAAGSTVVLVDDVPTVVGVDPRCPLKAAGFGFIPAESCRTDNVRNDWMISNFDQIVARNPAVLRITPSDLFCSDSACDLSIAGVPVYHDDNHLNDVSARALASAYVAARGNPLGRN
ncbi:MAG: acyltransferase family protein [Pseudomonadota bacterium]